MRTINSDCWFSEDKKIKIMDSSVKRGCAHRIEVWPCSDLCEAVGIRAVAHRPGAALGVVLVKPAQLGLHESLCVSHAARFGCLSRSVLR